MDSVHSSIKIIFVCFGAFLKFAKLVYKVGEVVQEFWLWYESPELISV